MGNNKKIKVNTKEMFDIRYGNAFKDLKVLMGQTKVTIEHMLHDEDNDVAFISCGQVMGMFWCEVIDRVAKREWDVMFAMKAIEAMNKVLPEQLTTNADFTAGFEAVVIGLGEEKQQVLAEFGVEFEPQEIN